MLFPFISRQAGSARKLPSITSVFSALLVLGAMGALLIGLRNAREQRNVLRELRQRGHQVRPTAVDLNQSNGRHSSYSVSYRFLPDLQNANERARREKSNDPWIRGGHALSYDLYQTLALGNERIVTYLPEAPSINVIGEVTEERISQVGLRNPILWAAGIFLAITAVQGFRQLIMKRRRPAPEAVG
jgi:hypothetical protein